jgi:hypothetical protein
MHISKFLNPERRIAALNRYYRANPFVIAIMPAEDAIDSWVQIPVVALLTKRGNED